MGPSLTVSHHFQLRVGSIIAVTGVAALQVERVLQINIAVLAGLGTLLLSLGQPDAQLSVIAILAAATSIIFTDVLGWVRLNRFVANIAALLALGLTISEFFSFDSTSQLLSIAKLLIYLQIVLLFQKKTTRLYWHLMMLSLLQVVVGAALNLGVLFGMMMVVYMLLAISALSVFFIYRETERFHSPDASDPYPSTQPRPSSSVFGSLRLFGKASTPRPVLMTGEKPEDFARRGMGWGMLRRTTGIGLSTIAIAGVIFIAMPRQGKGLWRVGNALQQRSVGFTETVRLGALGEVSQNPAEVMEVSFLEGNNTTPIQLSEPPLLRGTVLTRYEEGIWKLRGRRRAQGPWRLESPPSRSRVVRQAIAIEPLDTDVLFGVYPHYSVPGGDTIELHPWEGHLTRSEDDMRRRYSYELNTTGIYLGAQHAIAPGTRYDDWRPRLNHTNPNLNPDSWLSWELLQLPAKGRIETLTSAAKDTLAASQIDKHDNIAKAKAMERYFLSGDFTYSLSLRRHDPKLDPVEDFVRNHRSGNCEYFATALTLMLRTQGIPARMVVGFKGADWNPLGRFYQVRQLHAHTWVEAYLVDIPESDPAYQGPSYRYGYWLRLDPTPSATAGTAFDDGSVLSSIADLGDYLESLWKTYVVGLNAEQQKASIYQPFADRAKRLFDQLAFTPSWDGLKRAATSALDWLLANWLSWQVAVMAVCTLMATVLLFRLIRAARRWWRRTAHARRIEAEANSRQVEFYSRLEGMLRLHGLVRGHAETQREFLLGIPGYFEAKPEATASSPFLRTVASAFYRVRFGGHTLDNQEVVAVQQALAKLEHLFQEADAQGRSASSNGAGRPHATGSAHASAGR